MKAPKKIADTELIAHIEQTIPNFHAARLANLGKLKLGELLRSKNPYLFRAKNILLASDLIQGFLAARLSSQEESIFGTFLEQLAVFVAGAAWEGRKSVAEGIDLEIEKEGVLFLFTIKSGPDWGNKDQIARMRDNFKKAARIYRSNAPARPLEFINGCCYGSMANEERGGYRKLCGQSFWEFISGDPDFYRRIIEPIGHQARERNEKFAEEYAKTLNHFTQQFIADFCQLDGAIDWKKLLAYNSARPAPKPPRAKAKPAK